MAEAKLPRVDPATLREGFELAGKALEAHLGCKRAEARFQQMLNRVVQMAQLDRPDLYIVGTDYRLRCLNAEDALADNLVRAARAKRAQISAAVKFQNIRVVDLPENMKPTHAALGRHHESEVFDAVSKLRRLRTMAVLRLPAEKLLEE